MAIDTASKRRSALNYIVRTYRNGPIPDGSLTQLQDRRTMLHHYNGVAEIQLNTGFIFDVTIFDKAIAESDGVAVDNGNLGTISYVFDDMANNNGQVTLPFG